jgi:hypothetical protein
MRAYMHALNPDYSCKIYEMRSVQAVAKHRMVRSAGEYPRFRRNAQIVNRTCTTYFRP